MASLLDQPERSELYSRAERFTPYLAVRTPSDAVYLVRTHDAHIGRSLFTKGRRSEMGIIRRAAALLRHIDGPDALAEKTFLDVGANIGTSVITALLEYDFADAVTFEPEADNFETLRLNLVLNGVADRVAALNVAVSDKPGSAELAVNDTQSGKHFIATYSGDESMATVVVPTVTLDDLSVRRIIDAPRVGMIFIDAQSHEGHILRGAQVLTQRGCPVVFEFDPRGALRAGDFELLVEILRQHYTHFVDLRKSRIPDTPEYELRALDELDQFVQQYVGDTRLTRYSDVLAVRLPSDHAIERDLTPIMGGKKQP